MTGAQPPNSRALRRLGILGDIHCENERLATALEFFQTQQLDLVCAVGDIADGAGDVNHTVELLTEHRVLAVRGNHERWIFAGEMRHATWATPRASIRQEALLYLSELSLVRRLDTVAGKVMLCHGIGTDDMAGVWPDDDALKLHSNYALWQLISKNEYQFIINGHTHQRLVRNFANLTIINAGTLLRHHKPCFCIVDFEQLFVQFYDFTSALTFVPAEQFKLQ